jgi:hypothetical protein
MGREYKYKVKRMAHPNPDILIRNSGIVIKHRALSVYGLPGRTNPCNLFLPEVETVLFLGTLAIQSPVDTIAGFIIGLAIVIALSFIMFKGIYRLDVSHFFRYTSILLIENVWDVNPPQIQIRRRITAARFL